MPAPSEALTNHSDPDTADSGASIENGNASREKADQNTESGTDRETGPGDTAANSATRGDRWRRMLFYGVLPGLVMALAVPSGLFKWWESSSMDSQTARVESVQAAKDSTVAMLSYRADTVEKDLTAAQNRLTGTFRSSYMKLIHDVVIPGAKEKHISAVANVPAVASVSATPDHAVALVFINQTAIVGNDAPTDTASSVKVTLDKVDGRWLISDFTPI